MAERIAALFDIDGTLIITGGAGAAAWRLAFEEAKRSQLVECATAAIAELGYAHTSLAEIARRAGVSKGVVSYHFAGKEELLEQLVIDVNTRRGGHRRPHRAGDVPSRGAWIRQRG